MPTERGFVEALGVGRAGLVEATVLHADGTTATYTVADLDADPERFNERLSKFGILRDAMDRAEPVEIEYPRQTDGGRAIDSVKRLTRDVLARPSDTSVATGLVIGLTVGFVVEVGARGEATDRAVLALLTNSGPENFVIALQAPERHAAVAMVALAREAQADGAAIAVTYDTKQRLVTEIERNDLAGLGGGREDERFSAFVEAIAHAPVSNLMLVSVTTAPEFAAPGNYVPLVDFTPAPRLLAVVHGSPEYALLEAALRDKLRVEILATRGRGDDDDAKDNDNGGDVVRRAMTGAGQTAAASLPATAYLVRGTLLQHALCSASRPVWIEVNRRALDVGPDACCADGLPTNDMRPQSIREIDLPYRAAWIGHGCFNHGVYRIQLRTDRKFAVFVDGEQICLHASEDGSIVFGHACLDGDHEIRVDFENWKCRANFDMDVYRIR